MRVVVTNVRSRVYANSNEEAQRLSAVAGELCVMAPGAQYTWLYKQRKWDGKVWVVRKSLSGDDTHYEVPTGYLPTFLEKVRVKPVVLDDQRLIPQLDLQQTTVPLRNYQWETTKAVMQNSFLGTWWPRGVVRLATGLGKTETAVAMLQMVNRPSIFLVHRKDLLDQAHARMLKYGLRAGRVGDGEYDPQFHTVATVQTLGSLLAEENWARLQFLKDVEFAFVDEAHGIAADLDKGNLYTKVLALLENAYVRVGLTATPFMRDSYSNMLLEGSTGRLLVERDTRWGIDNGYLSEARVKMITIPALPDSLFKPVKGEDGKMPSRYAMAYVNAVEHYDRRNVAILDALVTLPKPALVLVKTTTHGRRLTELAKQRGIDLPFIHGKHPLAQRKTAVFKMVNEPGYLMATGIFNEGIDIPALKGLVLAAGGKSEGMLMQQMGRGLRQFVGKSELQVVDFYDLSRPLLPHSKGRRALWESEGYKVEIS